MINSIFNEQLRNGRLLLLRQRCQWQCARSYNYFDFNYFNEFARGKSFHFHFDSHQFLLLFLYCSCSVSLSSHFSKIIMFQTFWLVCIGNSSKTEWCCPLAKKHAWKLLWRGNDVSHITLLLVSAFNVPLNIFTKRVFFSFFIPHYEK